MGTWHDVLSQRLAIGAPKDDDGKVLVYMYKAGHLAQIIEPPKDAVGTLFGQSVAMRVHYLVVGGPGFDYGTGLAFVYYLVEAKAGHWDEYWKFVTTIYPSDGIKGDAFGSSVDIDDNAILVGAYKADHETGAAYYFNIDGKGQWTEIANLAITSKNVKLEKGDTFGFSVAVCESCNTALIGAPGDDKEAGAVYIVDHKSCDDK